MTVVYRDKAGVVQMTPVPFSNEEELQNALQAYPELLRDGDEPVLSFLGRAVYLGDAGYADLLFLDGDAKLSVVEVKLASNGESRREVLAQAFDYTSALADNTMDELDSLLSGELEKHLQVLAGEGDDSRARYNRLWESCANSMRAGSVRLVVAMDREREDLARIVRFVGDHSDLDMRLLVVSKYASGDKTVLVPEFAVHGADTEVTRRPTSRKGGLSIHQQLQVEYWTRYGEYMSGSRVPPGPAQPKNWIRHPIGAGDASLYSVADMFGRVGSRTAPQLRAEFGVLTGDPRPAFAWFEKRKAHVEAALGVSLVWDSSSQKGYCRAYLAEAADLRERDKWPAQHKWLRENIEKMYDVFMPLIKEYDASK